MLFEMMMLKIRTIGFFAERMRIMFSQPQKGSFKIAIFAAL
jgi:hypothetical protein